MSLILFSGLDDVLTVFLGTCINKHHLPHWLLAVPLHHFLSGCSVPYQPIYDQLNVDHMTDEWWGVQYLKNDMNKLNLVKAYKAVSRGGPVYVWQMFFAV